MIPAELSPPPPDVQILHAIGASQVDELLALYADTWWAQQRTREQVTRMLESSDLVVGLVDARDHRLVECACHHHLK